MTQNISAAYSIDYQLNNIHAAAKKLLSLAGTEHIWLFEGEMAAGKTTLIAAICEVLGVDEPVSSPTYSLVNEYITTAGRSIFHFDFYRLKTEEEALDYGLYDYLSTGAMCFCEWPSKIENFWPEAYLYIYIEKTKDGRRLQIKQIKK
jgi:tRNA threonylcarbamoyladenosine biosynthesis protein TsaE